LAEGEEKEALPREAPDEKTYSSARRKLVKFFERSRNQWKAKAGAAQSGRKRLGARVRRLARSTADSQQHGAALQTQVAEGQAQHAQTVRELEEVKKKVSAPQPGVVTGSELGAERVRPHHYRVPHVWLVGS
jgi:hypothetical protein